MSRPVIGLRFLGRLGNAMFSYAFARAHAERNGATLCTDHWIGQKIFDIDDPLTPVGLPRRDENTIGESEVNCEIRSYCQQQKCLIYTREQVRRWFKLRPEIKTSLEAMPHIGDNFAHVRRGDFVGYQFPIVSTRSYLEAALKFDVQNLYFLTEEDALLRTPFGFHNDLSMLPDFYRMMTANVLFRANSSFSFWAGVLCQGRVFSPVIDAVKVGGVETDCPFIESNHPRLQLLDYTTDLHLRES